MYRTRLYLWTSIVLALSGAMIAGSAFAQQNRIRDYQNKLEKVITEELEEFRSDALAQQRETLSSMNAEGLWIRPQTIPQPQPDPETAQERRDALEDSIEGLKRPFKSVVNVYESNDGDGQDVEIRITTPIDSFMEFAPIAALEAAAIPHKFPVVYIYLREETTDRVARVAFRDAEPIAARYLAGDVDAVSDMAGILIWH